MLGGLTSPISHSTGDAGRGRCFDQPVLLLPWAREREQVGPSRPAGNAARLEGRGGGPRKGAADTGKVARQEITLQGVSRRKTNKHQGLGNRLQRGPIRCRVKNRFSFVAQGVRGLHATYFFPHPVPCWIRSGSGSVRRGRRGAAGPTRRAT